MPDPFLFNPVKVVITILVALLPAIIYAIIIRYSEKYEREPWGSIAQAFMWGGTLGIILVILFRGFLRVYIEDNYPVIASDEQYFTLILVCFITPFVAELIKPIGLLFVRGDINEAEDGLIYGAVIGLGYTATENIFFGIFLAPLYGVWTFVTIVFMRSMSVMFIQSSATALSCYGFTRAMKVKHKTGSYFTAPLFLFAAIGIHAAFNYIVFMNLFDVGDIFFSMSSSLIFSIIFALIFMFMIYHKIYKLDREDEEKREDQEDAQEYGQPVGEDYGYDYDRPAPQPRQRPMPYYDSPGMRPEPPPRQQRDLRYSYPPPSRPRRPPPRRVPGRPGRPQYPAPRPPHHLTPEQASAPPQPRSQAHRAQYPYPTTQQPHQRPPRSRESVQIAPVESEPQVRSEEHKKRSTKQSVVEGKTIPVTSQKPKKSQKSEPATTIPKTPTGKTPAEKTPIKKAPEAVIIRQPKKKPEKKSEPEGEEEVSEDEVVFEVEESKDEEIDIDWED
jgi:RsiW-degrading membrane proteinase PrsW (M82 family)